MTAAAVGAPPAGDAPARSGGWRRARWWVALVVVIVLAAVAVGTLSQSPAGDLDPASAKPGGSLALAHVLTHYGTTVHTTDSLGDARSGGRPVVVIDPDAYSGGQLRTLAARATLVLVRPGRRAAAAVLPGTAPGGSPSPSPGCAAPAARAAGDVDFPEATTAYRSSGGAAACYGGAVLIASRVVLLGAADLLRNDELANRGIAALDVNLISADRTARDVAWLLPGPDAGGPGPASIWDLFPDGVARVAAWLAVLALLVVLWRARRLGPPVREPLPVVVRAAELVEGHGRLYARAGARERAAAALREATAGRLAARLALPRGAEPQQVAVAVAGQLHRPPADVAALLAGPPPADDAALARLAHDLDLLETAVTGGGT